MYWQMPWVMVWSTIASVSWMSALISSFKALSRLSSRYCCEHFLSFFSFSLKPWNCLLLFYMLPVGFSSSSLFSFLIIVLPFYVLFLFPINTLSCFGLQGPGPKGGDTVTICDTRSGDLHWTFLFLFMFDYICLVTWPILETLYSFSHWGNLLPSAGISTSTPQGFPDVAKTQWLGGQHII